MIEEINSCITFTEFTHKEYSHKTSLLALVSSLWTLTLKTM